MSSNQAHPGAESATAARRAKAFEYRIAGNSYRAIAAQLGVSHTQVENDVRVELEALARVTQAHAAVLRDLELARLDIAQMAIVKPVQAGNLGAIDRWLRISERRAKLLGLDAPTRQEHSGPDGGPIETRQHPLDLTKLTDADLEQIAALNAKLQGDAPSP